MKYKKTQLETFHPGIPFALSIFVAILVISYWTAVRLSIPHIELHEAASDVSALRRYEIATGEQVTMRVGETVRLTTEGSYGTATMPIHSIWKLIGGGEFGYLSSQCKAECAFTAEGPGVSIVEAEPESYNAPARRAIISIEGKREPRSDPNDDTVPQWAQPSVYELNRLRIMLGYDDGRFGASDPLTRGQIVTLMYRMLRHENLIRNPRNCIQYYDDVPADHYAYESACALRGWLTSLQSLEPNKPASRARTASLFTRILGPSLLSSRSTTLTQMMNTGQVYSDIPRNHYIFPDSIVLFRSGIMQGYPDGTFRPDTILNRAEAATLVSRTLGVIRDRRIRDL